MTETRTIPPVVRELTVAAPVDTCFATFLDRFGEWWPPEHHIGEDRTIVEMHIEPEVGGRCYDVDETGGVCHWGTVLDLDRPHRLVVAWHIQGNWLVDLDPARQSEVEVTFTPLDGERTAVRLEHRYLERHGEGGASLAGAIGSEGGWVVLLQRMGDVAEGRAPRPLPAPAG